MEKMSEKMLNQKFIRTRGRPRKKLEDKLSEVLTTDKQKAFLRNRMAGMNKRQAAIQAGYAPSTASIMAKRIMDKLSCNRDYVEEMERQGLTIPKLVSAHKELLKAMHPFCPDQPDNKTRLIAIEMAFKLWDVFPSRKKSIQETGTHQELSIDDVKREQRSKEEKILIRKDVREASEEPTR